MSFQRWCVVVGLSILGTACGTTPAQRIKAGGVPIGQSDARPSPRASSPGYVVLEPARLQSETLRCQRRPMSEVAYERTLEQAMSHVESVRKNARSAYSRPVYVGVRSCGPYRAVTIGDRYTRAKLVYDDAGALVAVFESDDVHEAKCLVDSDDATVHYGRAVDCTEGDLVFPSG